MGTVERREREKLARKSSILDAARHVFFAKGLLAATVDEIAERAELSKGAIYLYFRSKEEMYVSLMNEGMDILFGYFHEAIRPKLPADKLLLRIKDAYYRFYQHNREYFTILFLYFHTDIRKKLSPEIIASCEQKALWCLKVLTDVVERGIKDGIFRKCNAWHTVLAGWSSFNGIIMLAEQDKQHATTFGFEVKQLLDLSVDMLIRGLKMCS
jgi:AcrR family transcriptional regulator